jgi:hypothetical protein
MLAEAVDARLCTIWDCVLEALTLLRRHFSYAITRVSTTN